MKRSFVLYLVIFLAFMVSTTRTQALRFQIPITIADSGIKISTGRLMIGLHPDATTCLDNIPLRGFVNRWSEYDEWGTVIEQECVPPGPGFDARFSYPTAICGASPCREDIHKSVSPTQVDTFRFNVQVDQTLGDDIHSIKFRWPKVLSEYADSVILARGVGSTRFRVNMAMQDSFIVPNYSISLLGRNVTQIFIIIKNPKTPPAAPTVTTTAPVDNATNVSLTPTFQWNSVSQAYYYRFQLAKDTLFTGINLVRTDSLAGSATSLTLSSALSQSTNYYWRILVSNPYGVSYYQSPPLHFQTGSVGAVDPSKDGIPSSFALAQNYPNPFNPTTEIRYQLAERTHVSLKIFDSLGREVRTLVDEVEEAGYKSVQFDAKNLPSGEYTYRLVAGSFVEVKKMLLVK
jgi:hypothetical protein